MRAEEAKSMVPVVLLATCAIATIFGITGYAAYQDGKPMAAGLLFIMGGLPLLIVIVTNIQDYFSMKKYSAADKISLAVLCGILSVLGFGFDFVLLGAILLVCAIALSWSAWRSRKAG
jgi:hypothetical protein